MRKAMVAPSLLTLLLIFCLSVPQGRAGGKTYYDADGNPISERAYREMRQRRQRCLETTSDHQAFTRCMERMAAPAPSGPPVVERRTVRPQPAPETAAVSTPPVEAPERVPPPPRTERAAPVGAPPVEPPVSPTEPEPVPAAQPDARAAPEAARRTVPEPAASAETAGPVNETAPPTKMEHPVIPGQTEQPVRVIEREIAVPGGGVLKVKEYQYE